MSMYILGAFSALVLQEVLGSQSKQLEALYDPDHVLDIVPTHFFFLL